MKLDRYYKLRYHMKTGDLLLYKSCSTIGWLIRRFTKADVNHAGLVVHLVDYGGERRFTLEALEGGIEFHILSQRFKKFKGEVYWYQLKDEFDFQRYDIGTWAFKHTGVGYDYSSLLKQAVCRVSADAERFWCSEYCYMAYRDCGIVERLAYPPTPGDMPELGIFKDPIQLF